MVNDEVLLGAQTFAHARHAVTGRHTRQQSSRTGLLPRVPLRLFTTHARSPIETEVEGVIACVRARSILAG